MKNSFLRTVPLYLLSMLLGFGLHAQSVQVVNNVGLTFSPNSVNITEGDTVQWMIAGNHNVLEVSLATFNANGTTALPGGFSTPFGGGKVAFDTPGTYYYVCTPHASAGMKGTITVTAAAQTGEDFVAHLSGNQEVPSVPSLATGMVTATISNDSLFVQGSFEGLSSDFDPSVGGTGAHLHMGLAGRNGGILIDLVPTVNADNRSGSFTIANNSVALTPAQADLIRGRQVYVNIHTIGNPAGELRGQLVPEGSMYFFTNIYGSHEPTPVYSEASGAMIFELDGNTLTATGSFDNLEGIFDGNPAGGVHIHNGITGVNGGIVTSLMPMVDADMKGATFMASNNSYTLSATEVELLMERKLYVNVHTTLHPGGEIRGQIHGMAQAVFRAFLSGANEVPSVSVLGGGVVMAELIDDELLVSGSFAGLESDYNAAIGSHIHMAFAGSNGGVLFNLVPELDSDNRGGIYEVGANTITLTGADQNALLGRMMYVNIHSTEVPSGELRGQVLPEANYVFNAYLAGGQESLPVLSRGYGVFHGEVRGSRLTVTGSFSGLESDYNGAIGSHLHKGFFGQNGPVILGLMPTLSADNRSATYSPMGNSAMLSQGLKDSLRSRAIYANVHSTNIPSGELRGQMLQESRAYFFAPLSGSDEVPMPVNTPAAGATVLELIGNTATVSGSFAGLQSNIDLTIAGGAHIHDGLPGQAGPILSLLETEVGSDDRSGVFMAVDNRITLSSGKIDSLRDGFFYVNIHSEDVGSGELRGTFLPQAQAYFTSTFSGANEVDPVVSNGKGALVAALNGSTLTLAASFSELDGDFDPNVAGGSHLHRAGNGMNGPVFQVLNVTTPDPTDLGTGFYTLSENSFMLSAGEIDSLFGAMVYFNLHTTTEPSGEIRGQILPQLNFFPTMMPMISAPGSNSTVTIEGTGAEPFQATWTESMDENPLSYIWQLSADEAFGSFILHVNVGSMPEFNSDFATVDSILEAAGLNAGDSLLVYHRAIASDGALQLIGATDSVFLKRGTISSTDRELNDGLKVSLHPNRVSANAQLMIESIRPGMARIEVMTLDGRVLNRQEITLIGGSQSYGINFSSMSSGMYLVRIQSEDFQPRIIRVVKE